MQSKPIFSVSSPCHISASIAFVCLIGLLHFNASAVEKSPGKQMAEATIQNENAEREEEKEGEEERAKKLEPADFKNRLSARRISEYAGFDRALFDKSFDIGYSMNYSQVGSFFAQRELTQGFFLSTGLGKRTGISLSLDRSKLSEYITFGSNPELISNSTSSSGSLSLNHMLLPETLMLPELVANIALGGGSGEGVGFRTRGVGVNTSRTLESASLFGSLQFQQSRFDGGDWQSSRSLGISYFLTVNHRLAAGLGYGLSKSETSLSVPSTSATLVYRLFPDWVVRGTASRVSGDQESNNLAVDLTYTFQP